MRKLSLFAIVLFSLVSIASARQLGQNPAIFSVVAAGGALSIDTVTTKNPADSTGKSSTATFTNAGNYSLAGVIVRNSASNVPTLLTDNQVTMSLVGSTVPAGGFVSIYVYGLTNPAIGASSVCVTMNQTTNAYDLIVYTFNNANSVTPVAATVGGADLNATAKSSTMTVTSATNQIIIDFLNRQTGTTDQPVVNASQTSQSNQTFTVAGAECWGASSSRAGAAGTTNMSWTWTGGQRECHFALAIQP